MAVAVDVSKCAVLELSAECVQMKFEMKQISGKLKLVDGRYILRCNSPWWHIDTSNIYECSSKSSQPTTCIVFGWAFISWHFPFHSLNNSRHFWDELNLEFDMYNFNTNKKFCDFCFELFNPFHEMLKLFEERQFHFQGSMEM